MGIPTMVFLIVAMAFVFGRRGGRGRWDSRGRALPGEGYGAPWHQGRVAPPADPVRDDVIESLETRIARLEERLDFTERLLEKRSRGDGGTED